MPPVLPDVTTPPRLLTRFAPAPTGHLHLGHVVNALYVWGLAHAHRADVVLRLEDHDRQRSRATFEAQLLDDLDWLGFEPDRYPTATFRAGRCDSRQSDREAIYRAASNELGRRGLIYGCACTRQELVRGRAEAGEALRYLGTCRERAIPLGPDVSWRLRLDAPLDEHWDDLLVPRGETTHQDTGDPVIRDRHGNWTYQFAVVVDDFAQDIGLVVRGLDLAPSTPLQIGIARLLGRATPPRFAHHPLLMKSAREKLSKSDGDTGIVALRHAGWSPARVIGRAAFLAGLTSTEAPLPADAVPSLFASPPSPA